MINLFFFNEKEEIIQEISIILTFYTLQDRMGEIVYQINGYDVINYRNTLALPLQVFGSLGLSFCWAWICISRSCCLDKVALRLRLRFLMYSILGDFLMPRFL